MRKLYIKQLFEMMQILLSRITPSIMRAIEIIMFIFGTITAGKRVLEKNWYRNFHRWN